MSVPVSLAQEAVEKLIEGIVDENLCDCEHRDRRGGDGLPGPCDDCLRARLRGVASAAQLAALESVAKEMCDLCARPETYPAAAMTAIERGGKRVERWRHVEGEDSYLCDAGVAWTAWARLRSGGSQTREGEAGSGSESGKETAK